MQTVISRPPAHLQCSVTYNRFSEPPAGQLRLVPATASFTSGLLSAAAKLFPSTLFSTGGDEVNLPCYDADAPTQAYLNASGKSVEQALADFVLDVHKGIRGVGKSAVVWEGQ
jgi:hexosaminidase